MPPTIKEYNDQECQTPGPGPGAYVLPSPWKGPAFSIGKRVDVRIRSDTPGPIYDVRGLNRYGRDSCQLGYSINSRVKFSRKDLIPGPGAYEPEKHPYPKGASPAFSIAGRLDKMRKWQGPGPNQYILPPTLGWNVPNMKSGPAARISGRFSLKLKSDSPGPATYGCPNYDAIKAVFPAVSIGGRTGLKIKSVSPGPLAYYPQYRTGPNAPAFSIRSRVGRCIKPYITPLDACD